MSTHRLPAEHPCIYTLRERHSNLNIRLFPPWPHYSHERFKFRPWCGFVRDLVSFWRHECRGIEDTLNIQCNVFYTPKPEKRLFIHPPQPSASCPEPQETFFLHLHTEWPALLIISLQRLSRSPISFKLPRPKGILPCPPFYQSCFQHHLS